MCVCVCVLALALIFVHFWENLYRNYIWGFFKRVRKWELKFTQQNCLAEDHFWYPQGPHNLKFIPVIRSVLYSVLTSNFSTFFKISCPGLEFNQYIPYCIISIIVQVYDRLSLTGWMYHFSFKWENWDCYSGHG